MNGLLLQPRECLRQMSPAGYLAGMAEIRTKRLLLRPAMEADLPAIHAILSSPRATAYWSTPPHDTLDQSREWLHSMIAIDPLQGEDFVVELFPVSTYGPDLRL